MNKKRLSKSDIKAKFITPAILKSGWDEQTQLGREILPLNLLFSLLIIPLDLVLLSSLI